MLSDLAKQLIDEPNFATVATLNPDGSIQQSVVWVESHGETVLFSTVVGRVKERNLSRDPSISMLIIDRNDPYRYVSIRGSAVITPDTEDVKIDELSRKYTGSDWSGPRDGERVNITIDIDRISQYPPA